MSDDDIDRLIDEALAQSEADRAVVEEWIDSLPEGQTPGVRIVTYSGSVYEIAPQEKFVRRLNGVINPTPRQGPDGVWKHYENKPLILVGYPVIFDWDGKGHCTITTDIVELANVGVSLGDVVP